MNFKSQMCIFISLLALSQSAAVQQTDKYWANHHHKPQTSCKSHFNGIILPHDTDCHKFFVCVNNVPVEYNCDANFHFDKNSRSCMSGNECGDFELDIPASCSEGSVRGIADDCYIFETCINGQYQKINCPSGYYFYEPHSMCRPIHYNAHFKCNCVLPEHTVMENRDNCETYYVCTARRALLQKCPLNQYYNSTINACLPDMEGVCLMQPTRVPLHKHTQRSEKLFNTETKVVCEHLDNHEVHFQAYNGDCNKFYVCANGQIYVQQCPKGFYYEANQNYCVVDTENKCKNGKLTTAEVGLVQEGQSADLEVNHDGEEIIQQQGPIFINEEIMLPLNLHHQTFPTQGRKKLVSKLMKF